MFRRHFLFLTFYEFSAVKPKTMDRMKSKRRNVSFSLFCCEYSLLHPLFVSIVDSMAKFTAFVFETIVMATAASVVTVVACNV